jgi:hypothetical protein
VPDNIPVIRALPEISDTDVYVLAPDVKVTEADMIISPLALSIMLVFNEPSRGCAKVKLTTPSTNIKQNRTFGITPKVLPVNNLFLNDRLKVMV